VQLGSGRTVVSSAAAATKPTSGPADSNVADAGLIDDFAAVGLGALVRSNSSTQVDLTAGQVRTWGRLSNDAPQGRQQATDGSATLTLSSMLPLGGACLAAAVTACWCDTGCMLGQGVPRVAAVAALC
jgi:hypothetical protein